MNASSDLVATARRLAAHHHDGQVDKAGQPYLGHIERVAERVGHLEPEVVATALLHDILEDTDVTADDLAAAGIPAAVIDAVVLLTKTGGPLHTYYEAIREHPVALAVKLADIADNSDPARLAQLAPDVRERLTNKYANAVEALRVFNIHVDRQQPPTLTFDDTGGDPILSYRPDEGGWVLHVQYYAPATVSSQPRCPRYRMDVAEFDEVDEALSKAQKRLRGGLPDVDMLELGKVRLRSVRGSSLTATLRQNGSLSIFGHDFGASEYEYWYKIEAEHVPALALKLGGIPGDDILLVLREHYLGDNALRLGPAIRDSGIKYGFSNWVSY